MRWRKFTQAVRNGKNIADGTSVIAWWTNTDPDMQGWATLRWIERFESWIRSDDGNMPLEDDELPTHYLIIEPPKERR